MKHSIHSMQSPIKLSVIAMVSATLMACGGGGGSNPTSSSTSTKPSEPSTPSNHTSDLSVTTKPTKPSIPSTPKKPSPTSQEDTTINTTNTNKPLTPILGVSKASQLIDKSASLAVLNEWNMRRMQCGIKAVKPQDNLQDASNQHAAYLAYLYASAQIQGYGYNGHVEHEDRNYIHVTGKKNPYYRGIQPSDRAKSAGYLSLSTENLSQGWFYSSLGHFQENTDRAVYMLNNLLAAPYHLAGLMDSRWTQGAASLIVYTPYKTDSKKNRGYILETMAGIHRDDANHHTTIQGINGDGIITYPCEGVTNTQTALYSESPNPFQGTRDLSINPIGQPIWINHPTANNIVVTNVKFFDTQRNISLKTHELTKDNDPNKRLRANEMFIIPLTDDIARNSCDANKLKLFRDSFKANSCGLYPDTKYQVSFDISVDGKPKTSHSFTFSTGKTNYG